MHPMLLSPGYQGGWCPIGAWTTTAASASTPPRHHLDTNIVTASIRAIVSGINRIQPDIAAVSDVRAA